MTLIKLWQDNSEVVLNWNIGQIVSSAGDGQLRDNSDCSKELRYFLNNAPTEKLYTYANYCLNSSFDKSGMVLQDIVNEFGRRLDYEVENGLYQGKRGEIGFDGIWKDPDGHAIIIETKTTDAYRINLNGIASYRERLIDSGAITKKSSILLVVGRNDTGDLEEQIRGSRHAWDARIISMDALIKLLELKIKSDEDETTEKIRSLLVPFEYTRLDNIIDVMFTTAKDVENTDAVDQSESIANDSIIKQQHTPREIIEDVRLRSINALSKKEEISLIAHKRSQYWNSDRSLRVVCPVSKRYESGGYWYAFHPHQKKFLSEGSKGYFMLGCVDSNFSFAIPLNDLVPVLPLLNKTEKEDDKSYWHIHVDPNESGVYELKIPNNKNLNLEPYKVALSG